MRVLWLVKGLGAGGAERLLALSAELRDRTAIDPQVAYLLEYKQALRAEFDQAEVFTTCLCARAWWDLRWLIRLRRLCRSRRFDLIHSHSPITTIGARLVLRSLSRHGRPSLVTTEHNVWGSHHRVTRVTDTVTARRSETHVAVSHAVRASMPVRLQLETRVIQYGVDLCEVRKATVQREAARRSLGVGPDEVLIGTVANLRGTKGYPDLLAAARTVVDQIDNVRFVALGQGPMQRELHDRAEELLLADRFRFLGYRPDAVQIMSGFDIFCLASHHEGLPIALMEALVLGLPVVATNVGGIAEIVTDGREAILVPPGEPQQLAAALMTVARDPALRAEMSLHAVASGDTLDVRLALREIENLYREVLDQ